MSESNKTTPQPTAHERRMYIAQWDRETDVAVVGFGGAGGCAAIEAADAGCRGHHLRTGQRHPADRPPCPAPRSTWAAVAAPGCKSACGFEDSTEDDDSPT